MVSIKFLDIVKMISVAHNNASKEKNSIFDKINDVVFSDNPNSIKNNKNYDEGIVQCYNNDIFYELNIENDQIKQLDIYDGCEGNLTKCKSKYEIVVPDSSFTCYKPMSKCDKDNSIETEDKHKINMAKIYVYDESKVRNIYTEKGKLEFIINISVLPFERNKVIGCVDVVPANKKDTTKLHWYYKVPENIAEQFNKEKGFEIEKP